MREKRCVIKGFYPAFYPLFLCISEAEPGSHQHLVQVDVQQSEDSGHEGRRLLLGLAGSALGLLLHHWLLGLLLLGLILLLLVLCAVLEKQFNSHCMATAEPPLTHTVLTLPSPSRSRPSPQTWQQLSARGRDKTNGSRYGSRPLSH